MDDAERDRLFNEPIWDRTDLLSYLTASQQATRTFIKAIINGSALPPKVVHDGISYWPRELFIDWLFANRSLFDSGPDDPGVSDEMVRWVRDESQILEWMI